jgi:hypothetical protein
LGYVYKNIPPFQLMANDTLAFDLSAVNDADLQFDIALAPTTVNGGDQPSGAFTTVVTNTQTPLNPRGNAVNGDFELQFNAQVPFSFSGGGLVIRFSNPGTQLAADVDGCGAGNATLTNTGDSTDPTGLFVKRFYLDADGLYPWDNTAADGVAAFRLVIEDPPATTPPPTTPPTSNGTKKKKCKKKRGKAAAAKKKCKKNK